MSDEQKETEETEGPHCGNCFHWAETKDDPSLFLKGKCRRYPPTPYKTAAGLGRWPITDADGMCGEHPAAKEG